MKFFMPWAEPYIFSPRAVVWASLPSATAIPRRSRSMAHRGITPFHGRFGAFSMHPELYTALGQLMPTERMLS